MRSKVWFQGLHDKVDHAMKECAACQSVIHTKRIERWGLRLQPYKLTITYQHGSDNPADCMSRHPSVKTIKSCEQ